MKNQFLVDELRNEASTQKRGKLIVLAGISGSGKSYILNMLRKNYNVASIQKIVTRPFRPTEIESILEGKNVDIKPVIDRFNDGEKTLGNDGTRSHAGAGKTVGDGRGRLRKGKERKSTPGAGRAGKDPGKAKGSVCGGNVPCGGMAPG